VEDLIRVRSQMELSKTLREMMGMSGGPVLNLIQKLEKYEGIHGGLNSKEEYEIESGARSLK